MRKYSFIFLLFILFFSFNTAIAFSEGYTTLIIVEENAKSTQVIDGFPVTDGIMDAMWDYNQYIFFDMKIESPLKIENEKIDVNSYINTAREAGADIILCVKIDYDLLVVENGFKVEFSDYFYNLFSLDNLEPLKEGKVSLAINETVDARAKDDYLKRIGSKILADILK